MWEIKKYNLIIITALIAIFLTIVASLSIYQHDPLANIRAEKDGRIVAGSDFNANYYAAKRYFSSDSLYFTNQQKLFFADELTLSGAASRFVYYPFSALFFTPISSWSFDRALFVLTALNIILLLSGILILTRLVKNKIAFLATIGALLLTSPILWSILERGQTDIIIFFFLVLSLHFFLNGKNKISGANLALAGLFKLTPLFLLPFFFLKKRKIFYSAVITFTVASLFLGFDRLRDFFSALGQFATNHSSSYMSTGLFGLFYNKITTQLLSSETAHLIYLIIIIPLLLLFFYGFHKKFRRDDQLTRLTGFGLFLAIMVLLPPVSWLQHCLHLLIIFTAYWFIRERSILDKKIIILDILVIMIFSSPMLLLLFQKLPGSIIFSLRPLYIILFIIFFYRLFQEYQKNNPQSANDSPPTTAPTPSLPKI